MSGKAFTWRRCWSARRLHTTHISPKFSLGVNALLNLPFLMAPCVVPAGGQTRAGSDNCEQPYLTDTVSN